jgi:hypothetical protein
MVPNTHMWLSPCFWCHGPMGRAAPILRPGAVAPGTEVATDSQETKQFGWIPLVIP